MRHTTKRRTGARKSKGLKKKRYLLGLTMVENKIKEISNTEKDMEENKLKDTGEKLMTKNCAKRHIRPLYVNFGGDISCCFWFGSECGTAQFSIFPFPLFSCCSIYPPWHMMWPYCIVEVDNFWSGLFPSVAQLSPDFHYFSCYPVLQQILSLTWIVSTIFCLRGAHQPRP